MVLSVGAGSGGVDVEAEAEARDWERVVMDDMVEIGW